MKFIKLVKSDKKVLTNEQILNEFSKLLKSLNDFRITLIDDYPIVDDECNEIRHKITALYSKINKN